jgi:hypothetical protein
MFSKVQKNGISLNLDKYAFMVFSWMILGFIASKEHKLLDPKNIQAIVNMPPPKNPQQKWDGIILHMFYKKLYCYYGTYH